MTKTRLHSIHEAVHINGNLVVMKRVRHCHQLSCEPALLKTIGNTLEANTNHAGI